MGSSSTSTKASLTPPTLRLDHSASRSRGAVGNDGSGGFELFGSQCFFHSLAILRSKNERLLVLGDSHEAAENDQSKESQRSGGVDKPRNRSPRTGPSVELRLGSVSLRLV